MWFLCLRSALTFNNSLIKTNKKPYNGEVFKKPLNLRLYSKRKIKTP